MTTWLFAISRRVAASYRRRAYLRREQPGEHSEAQARSQDCPERSAEHALARQRLDGILARMSLDQRAAFVMFEIDGMSGAEIAELSDRPLQTVFSRLRRAREVFEREVQRLQTIELRSRRQ